MEEVVYQSEPCKFCGMYVRRYEAPLVCPSCYDMAMALAASEYQSRIAAAVEARGYRKGWTDEQFAARQICKLVEELGELASAISLRRTGSIAWHGWLEALKRASVAARAAFDFPPPDKKDPYSNSWGHIDTVDHEVIKQELPDLIVIISVLAQLVGLNVLDAALDKSEKDIERGVR